MKILVISIHNLFDNRINRHMTTLIKKGHIVEYFNISKSNKENFEYIDDVKLTHINTDFSKNNLIAVIRALRVARKTISNSDSQIVHFHDPLLLSLSKFCKKRGKKVVFDKHESYETIKGLNGRISSLLERKYSRYIDGVVYVNTNQLKYLEYIGYKMKSMIPNYQLKSSYSLPRNSLRNRIRFIYIGSLSNETRNTSLMLNVMNRILEDNQNVEFILGGRIIDDEVKAIIDYMVLKRKNFEYKGVVKYSTVITDTINSDIGLYFAKDVPNNFMSSPNKIYEYLLSGLAIVSIGSFTDSQIINQSCGRVFDYSVKEQDLIDYISLLINDRKLLKKLKIVSQELGNKYTWESVEDNYIIMYTDLLSTN